jgi:hypothetical protein
VSELWGLLVLGGAYPLYRLWRSSRGWTLRHCVVWFGLAWAAWSLAAWFDGPGTQYLALALTACAGVAVLGARRPTVTAWHFVVGGLLLLLLRAFWEGMGELRLNGFHVTILGVALAVALGNYLPTRQGPTALLLGLWCVLDLARLTGTLAREWPLAWLALAAVPWLGLALARRGPTQDFDGVWRSFRDRYGFVWAQRLRDQFNRAAANAGWSISLGWSGLRQDASPAVEVEKPLALLRSMLRRFETEGNV